MTQAPPTPVLSVTPDNRDVSATAGNTTFSVANIGGGTMSWTATVTSGSSWLSITSGSSGTNSGTINVSYTANGGTSSRTGTITVTASGATGSPKNVTVTQAAPTPILSVTPDNRDVPATAGNTTFSVSNAGGGTMPWTATVTSGSSWLSITSGNSGTNNGTINIGYTTNGGTSSRTGTITVTASGATGGPKLVIVTQAGPPPQIGGIRPVSPTTVSGSANTEFDVYVEVQNVTNLFGVSFVLNFNKIYLNVIFDASESFIGSDVVYAAQHDNSAGTISIGISRKAGQGGVTGTGNVAKIHFKIVQGVTQNTSIQFTLSSIDANDPSGSSITLTSGSSSTTLTGGLTVWPGDTNNNGTVNQSDVLPIGLYWGTTGPVRPNRSNNWVSQPCTPWNTPQATYVDANGDGIINQVDVLPIGLNWGRTHSLQLNKSSASEPLGANVSSVVIAASIRPVSPATVSGSVNTEFDVYVEVQNVTNLFGVSFVLNFNKTYINALSESVESFIGSDLVFVGQHDNGAGTVGIGISRKAGQGGVSGTGNVAKVHFKVVQAVTQDTPVEFTLNSVEANDPSGLPISLIPGTTTTILIQSGTGVDIDTSFPTNFELLQSYPNPFNPETTISYSIPEQSHVTMEIYNITGKRIVTLKDAQENAGNYSIRWNGRDDFGRPVSGGVYLCRFQAGTYSQTIRMLLMK